MFCVFALFLELEDTGSADAVEDETVTADSLRKLAAELGERAPPRVRQLLRTVRLRDALPCLQGLAADLGVPFEVAVRDTLIDPEDRPVPVPVGFPQHVRTC